MSQYAKRRRALRQQIDPDGIIILPAAPEVIRNGDAHYPYRQDSDFYYLTGFTEPDAVMVLAPKRVDGEYVLFNRERDPEREVWDGPRVGQQGACQNFLADQAFAIDEFAALLPSLLAGRKTIYYPLGRYPAFDKMMLAATRQLKAKIRGGMQAPVIFADVLPFIHEMRLYKSVDEIRLMQRAIDISAYGHISAMQACRPGMNESALEAELTYLFKRHGAQHTAYTSIVGAGKNTCVLHYVANNQAIAQGDLVLIDAGAEYECYAADITRTFPANGRFSSEQRAVYEVVLAAQLAGIKTVRPGMSFAAAQTAIAKVITEGLIDLGILKGKLSTLLAQQAYQPFYMHKSGHWLGLDVHDAGQYKLKNKWRELRPGMALTVEPGIYLAATIPGLHKRWHNIGVRIEDDVLVTTTGCKVLSQPIPKTVADIEAIMAK